MATTPNPLLMQAMQRLASTMPRPGGGGAPGGPPSSGRPGPLSPALQGVQSAAAVPQGGERSELEEIEARCSSMSQRVQPRSYDASIHLAKACKEIQAAIEALAALPQERVSQPPPGFPFLGAALTPPTAETAPGPVPF